MKPVAIFRHSPSEGPGYFATFLEAHRIPWRLVAVDAGDAVPAAAESFSGLAFMGGPMSVNDPLQWIEPQCRLIRDAVERDIPVIGHCLGAQLFSKALGGSVTRNAVKEIGWGSLQLDIDAGEIGRRWLGPLAGDPEVTVFQWHAETFSTPPGATRLLTGPWCPNQVLALGPHLAMQCHIEMTPALIASWCSAWDQEAETSDGRGVQAPAAILAETERRLPLMRRLADQLYAVWIGGLRRN